MYSGIKCAFTLRSTVCGNVEQRRRDWNWEDLCVRDMGLCSETLIWKQYTLSLPKVKHGLLVLSLKKMERNNNSTFSQTSKFPADQGEQNLRRQTREQVHPNLPSRQGTPAFQLFHRLHKVGCLKGPTTISVRSVAI